MADPYRCPPGWQTVPTTVETPSCWRVGPRGNILVGIVTQLPQGPEAGIPVGLAKAKVLTREERALGTGVPGASEAPVIPEELVRSIEQQRMRPFPAPAPPLEMMASSLARAPRPVTRRGIVVTIPAEARTEFLRAWHQSARAKSPLALALQLAAYAVHNARFRVTPGQVVYGSSVVPRTEREGPGSPEEQTPRLAPVSYPVVVAFLQASLSQETLRSIRAERLISNRWNNYLQALGWRVCGRIPGTTFVIRCPPLRPPEATAVQFASRFLESGEDVFLFRQPRTTTRSRIP